MNRSTIFWSVLAILLGAGCIYYLLNWLYIGKVRAEQEKFRVLYTLAEGLLPADGPLTLLQQVAEVIPLVSDATHCSVWILNPASQQLEWAAGTHKPPTSTLSLSAIAGAVTCFRNQVITEVPDADDCPFIDKDTVRRFRQKSLLYLPIMAERSCLGVIEIENRRRKRIFPREQKARLEYVSKLAALGLWQRTQTLLKDRIHRNEKMATLGEFIEGVGEELVGPLGAIVALSQALNSENGSEALGGRLERIGQEARRASEALERLVKFARPGPRKFETIDLNLLLKQVADSSRQRWKEKGLRVNLELSKTPARVSIDTAHLGEILGTVIRHAEQFLDRLGRQNLDIYSDVLERRFLISLTPGSTPPPSATAGDGETSVEGKSVDGSPGLGLSVCKSLIEGAGGSLRVEKATSRGFRIEIEYPLAREEWDVTRSAPAESREGRHPPLTAMALVIDDDTGSQDVLLHSLSEHGHRVVVASSVEEGVDLAERVQFDWVFCKIQIGRLSALELYNRLQGRVGRFVFLADPKVLIFNEELFSGEDRHVLRKPIKGEEVDRLLETLQGRPSALDESKTAEV